MSNHLDPRQIRDLLRNNQTDPEAAGAASSSTSIQPEFEDWSSSAEKPILSLHRRRQARSVVASPNPSETEQSATDQSFTLSPSVYVPPTPPLQADTSATDPLFTLSPTIYVPPISSLATTYEDSSQTLLPTVYEGSSFTLSPTCYQAPPRSEFGPLPLTNQASPPPPPPRVEKNRQNLYNPAADRVPRTHSSRPPVNLNEDGKRTSAPWKSPNFPDLTCGHRIVVPQAFYEQEDILIKRYKTAKAQEQTEEDPEKTSRKRLSTIQEEKEISNEEEETFEGRERSSTAGKEDSEEQSKSVKAEDEDASPEEEGEDSSLEEEKKEETPEEEEDKETPEEEEDEESPEESPEDEDDEETDKKEDDEKSPEEEGDKSHEDAEDEHSPEKKDEDSPEEDDSKEPPQQEERNTALEDEKETRQDKGDTSRARNEGAKEQAQTSDYQNIASEALKVMAGDTKVPQPGPAKLGKNSELDQWLECAKKCQYLPEAIMKKLCEMVKELLMEESNVQPVSTPVTICGDIHGQFYDLLELFRVGGGMPDDTQIDAPTVATRIITSDDIEPPTEITDPKLRRQMKKPFSSSSSGGDSSTIGSEVSDDDDDEEGRGRPRGIEAELGMKKGNQEGLPGNQNYIFLGDFVDRGYFSLETFTLLMCLKAKFPDRITLVRGNHESRQITQVYGFYEECQQKYGNASVWKACCQVFDFLILAAVIDGKVLCVHGGLSPEIRTLDQIRVVARAQEIPHEGAFCDLVWSDPEDVETWAVSPRGAGWLFGDKVASEFNHVNGLQLIARAHQLVNEGFKWHFRDKSVVTVWSAPNYCYRCGNVASIMNLGEDLNPKFTIFSAVPDDQRAVPGATGRRADYFL